MSDGENDKLATKM